MGGSNHWGGGLLVLRSMWAHMISTSMIFFAQFPRQEAQQALLAEAEELIGGARRECRCVGLQTLAVL